MPYSQEKQLRATLQDLLPLNIQKLQVMMVWMKLDTSLRILDWKEGFGCSTRPLGVHQWCYWDLGMKEDVVRREKEREKKRKGIEKQVFEEHAFEEGGGG